jgi:hypothetical protein
MQTQVIPQKQYLIEGIPANKYGEWSGLKSNKWNGSIRVMRPKDRENLLNGKSFLLKYYKIPIRSICYASYWKTSFFSNKIR